jgi:hypothetical protein
MGYVVPHKLALDIIKINYIHVHAIIFNIDLNMDQKWTSQSLTNEKWIMVGG